MTGVVVVSHGLLARELIASAAMIVGESMTEGVSAVCLSPEEGIENFKNRVAELLRSYQQCEGVLVLADLFGGSPCNTAIELSMRWQDEMPIEVVAGVNLPMLIEVLLQRNTASLPELVAAAEEAGVGGVKSLRGELTRRDQEASRGF